VWDAVARPFQAVFVVGLCYFINQFTSPWAPWWHWVAFGMALSVLVAWARAFKTIAFLVAAFYVGRWVYRRYGDAAKARFDDWVGGRTAAPGSAAAAAAATSAAAPRDAQAVLRLIGNDAEVRKAGIVH
jgi:hypothetical protein